MARIFRKSDFQRPLVVFLCVFFVSALQFTYVNMDAPSFRYMGLRLKELDPFWAVLGFVMAALPSLWMPIKLERPSQVAYWILYLTVIVPVMWMPYHTLNKPPEHFVVFSSTMLLSFYLLGLSFRLPRWHVPRPQISDETFFVFVIVLVTLMTLAVWSTNGFRLDLGLRSIYSRRRESKDNIAMGSVLSYVKGNLASAIQPFAFAIGLARRSWVLVLLSLGAGLVGFSVDGSKTSAVIPFFLLLLYPMMTKFRREFGFIVPLMAGIGILLAYVAWKATNNPWIPVVTTWRLFDVKALLSGYYWEYFSTHQHMLLSDGILRAFFDNPYPHATPEQIGYVYFGSAETNSNSNLWSSAFADFGYAGMLAVTAVLAMIFRFIDSMALNRGFLIPAFLCSFLGMKLSDVALDTSMLSHGTLMTLILLYILPASQEKSPELEPRPGLVKALA